MVETRRVECDGVGLHVELNGADDAVTVLFLHGVGSSGRTWEWVSDEVTRGLRVVRVDLQERLVTLSAPEPPAPTDEVDALFLGEPEG